MLYCSFCRRELDDMTNNEQIIHTSICHISYNRHVSKSEEERRVFNEISSKIDELIIEIRREQSTR